MNIPIQPRKRFFRVVIVFIGILLDFSKEYSLIKKKGYAYSQIKMKRRHEKRAAQLYNTAISMQGVFIKLCQFFSARRDFFPDAYIRILSTLQDDVPPVPYGDIIAVLNGEYENIENHFSHIENEPVASASLGQVHRAFLRNGTEVVIKVLKPGVESRIDTDFAILYHVFRIMSKFSVFKERVDLMGLLDEFIKVTGDELNFRREAYMAAQFKKLLKDYTHIRVPMIYDELTTSRIIVMEALKGDKLSELEKWLPRNNDPVLLSRRIIGLYMDQLLDFGKVHFDPHPGNILIGSDSTFSLIDFGMSGIITAEMKRGLTRALKAFIDRNARDFIDALYDLGFIRKSTHRYSLLTVTEFFLNELLDIIRFDRESIQTLNFSPIREELIELIYTQPFNIPYEWAYIGKTIGILAGITATLNPDFKIHEELKPYAEKFLKRNVFSIASDSLERLTTNLTTLLQFPNRIDLLLDSIERGRFRFKVDYTEMIDKIDEMKVFAVRLLCLLLSVPGALGAYIFHIAGLRSFAITCFVLAAVSFAIAIVYHKKSFKSRLDKYF